MAADALTSMAVFLGVSIVRFGPDQWLGSWARIGIDPILMMAGWAATWVAAVWIQDLYRLRARWTIRTEALDVIRGAALVAILSFVVLFTVKLEDVSRLFLIALFLTQAIVTFGSRLLLRLAFRWVRSRGMSTRFVLIVGSGHTAQWFADRLERRHELGLQVVGHLEWRAGDGPRGTPDPPEDDGSDASASITRPMLGHVNDIEQVLHAHVVDEVVICLPPPAWGLIEAITRLCEEEGKIVRIPLADGAFDLPGARHEEFEGVPVLSLVYGPDRALALLAKRLIDIVASAAALVALSPLLVVVSIVIRLIDGPPVFFTQTRVGLHGREFRVVKFRTMVPDAEAQLDDLLDQNEISGHAFKLDDDPRLSRIGRWLRRTSIDELPQLANVLKGEMSLVGPRPPLPREVADYDVWHRRRLSMKPGITGLWQVSARREEHFDRWVELDLDYIDRWSVWLDVKIMARTIPAMLQGR